MINRQTIQKHTRKSNYIRGFVRPSVGWSVRPWVCQAFLKNREFNKIHGNSRKFGLSLLLRKYFLLKSLNSSDDTRSKIQPNSIKITIFRNSWPDDGLVFFYTFIRTFIHKDIRPGFCQKLRTS